MKNTLCAALLGMFMLGSTPANDDGPYDKEEIEYTDQGAVGFSLMYKDEIGILHSDYETVRKHGSVNVPEREGLEEKTKGMTEKEKADFMEECLSLDPKHIILDESCNKKVNYVAYRKDCEEVKKNRYKCEWKKLKGKKNKKKKKKFSELYLKYWKNLHTDEFKAKWKEDNNLDY